MADYHAIHGYDEASFDVPSETHRVATVSASQALDQVEDVNQTHISTGLAELDAALCGSGLTSEHGGGGGGGVQRGQVTEVWGPPGSGKTGLALQLAASALGLGDSVIWIDCFRPIRAQGLQHAIQNRKEALGDLSTSDDDDALSRFAHYQCLTLPHLLALILRPTPTSIPKETSLVVLDSLTALVNSALPKPNDGRTSDRVNKGTSPAVRRRQGLQAIMTALQKLAATRKCAVVLLSQCATRMHAERGTTLAPAVSAATWDQGLATRVVLFRDWIWSRNEPAGVLLAGLQKLNGKNSAEAVDRVAAFQITSMGSLVSVPLSAYEDGPDADQQKRKFGQTGLEVADSEDEDYGWQQEDEASLPAPPPQWQGSEDLLLGHDIDRSEDGEDEDEVEDEENDGERPDAGTTNNI